MYDLPDCMYDYRPSNIVEDDDRYYYCRECGQKELRSVLEQNDGLCEICFLEEEDYNG